MGIIGKKKDGEKRSRIRWRGSSALFMPESSASEPQSLAKSHTHGCNLQGLQHAFS